MIRTQCLAQGRAKARLIFGWSNRIPPVDYWRSARLPADLATVGSKRGSPEPFSERECSAGSRTRGSGGAGGLLVFECTLCGKAFSRSSTLTTQRPDETRTHPYQRPLRAHSLVFSLLPRITVWLPARSSSHFVSSSSQHRQTLELVLQNG